MSWNPLAEITDYRTMLNRICWFTAASACVGTWLLRFHFPAVETTLAPLDIKIELWGVKDVKLLGYILPGLAVALVARVIRLHDRISDIFGIRKRFDAKHILVPLASGAGIRQKDTTLGIMKAVRDDLMGPVFYKYASSTNPQIDKHLICEALDWWSWYWVIVESATIFVIVAIVLLFARAWETVGLIMIICIVAFLVVLPFLKHHCARYAKREVDEILMDSTRKKEVRKQVEKCITKQKGS
jgi:hypothetical protein